MACVALAIVRCLDQLPLTCEELATYAMSSVEIVQNLLNEGQKQKVVKQNEKGLWKLDVSISENVFVDYNLRFSIEDLLLESKVPISTKHIIDTLDISKERTQEVEIMLLAGEYSKSWTKANDKWEMIYSLEDIRQLLVNSCLDIPKTFTQFMEIMPQSVTTEDLLKVFNRIPRYNNIGWVPGFWQNINERYYMIHMYKLKKEQLQYTTIYDAIIGNPLTLDQISNMFQNMTTDEIVETMRCCDKIWKTQLKYNDKVDTYYMILDKPQEELNEKESQAQQEIREINKKEMEEQEDDEYVYPCTCDVKQCSIFEVLKWELPWLGDETNMDDNNVFDMNIEEMFKNPNIQISRSARQSMKQN
jgi:hypothetical protein